MQTNPEQWADNANVQRAVMASVNLGAWMSAALDDPKVCDAMKADIREWFSAGEPVSAIQAAFAEREARVLGALEWYGDTFCELGPSHECCGRLSSHACSGCHARDTLTALKDRTHG